MTHKPAEILKLSYYGNTVEDWMLALGLAAVAMVALRLIQAAGLRQVKSLAHRVNLQWAEAALGALEKTHTAVLALLALYIGSQGLTLPEKTQTIFRMVAIVSFLVQGGLWITALLDTWISRCRQQQMTSNPAAATSLGALSFLLRMGIWVCVAMLALDNLGVNITALVTGLGIGGVAVALAIQNILGDLFASLTIVLDKPFIVGDFLVLGDHMGTVEHVGLKTTRLRSLSGEQIVMSNSDLLGSRIRNYGRMFERRVLVTIGVTYGTPRVKLAKIPQIIRSAIESQKNTRFDRAHFKSYGAYSLDFEYVYYVQGADYNAYMDINQAINLTIHEEFEKEKIDFAFPTQTLIIEKQAA